MEAEGVVVVARKGTITEATKIVQGRRMRGVQGGATALHDGTSRRTTSDDPEARVGAGAGADLTRSAHGRVSRFRFNMPCSVTVISPATLTLYYSGCARIHAYHLV